MDLIRASYDQPPCQPGPTCRRNFLNVAKSTWHRMVKEELGLRAYKVLNNIVHHKNFQRVFILEYFVIKPDFGIFKNFYWHYNCGCFKYIFELTG